MSEVQIRVGNRPFTVACQPGEEKFLEAAAKLLDAEAATLVDQLGKMPETQMLLMAGLMLADKTAALEDQVAKGGSGKGGKAVKAEALPDKMAEKLAKLAERAEELAGALEEKTAG